MGDRQDPLDAYEPPPLAEQVEPYLEYGDAELAVSLLSFEKTFAVAVPSLADGSQRSPFDVRCQPANTGATHTCTDCETDVRLVSRPGEPFRCPACGRRVGALELGRGVRGDSDV